MLLFWLVPVMFRLGGIAWDAVLTELVCVLHLETATGSFHAQTLILCPQDLWGRCAGRNKEDAATLVEGLAVLQLRQVAERSQAAALEAAQARVQQLEARLAAAQAQPAPARPYLEQVAAALTAWPLILPVQVLLE